MIISHKPWIYTDSRGLFFESHPESLFRYRSDSPYSPMKEPPKFVQDNVSISKKGVVRGMHYQRAPMAQGKFLRCLRGSIFDVVINLKTSEVHTMTLDPFEGIYIPEGYAHGFQALEDETIVYYKCTNGYSKEHEMGLSPLDVEWPIAVTEVSEKDKLLPRWNNGREEKS